MFSTLLHERLSSMRCCTDVVRTLLISTVPGLVLAAMAALALALVLVEGNTASALSFFGD